MLNKIRQFKENKKGSGHIEFAIVLMTFVMLFSFMMDVFLIAYKDFVVSQNLNQITRRVAIQGGINDSTPNGFPGDIYNYMNNESIVNYLETKFKGVDIKSDEWELSLKGRSISLNGFSQPTYKNDDMITISPINKSSYLNVDYQDSLTVSITFKYTWTLWGQLFPKLNNLVSRTYSQHTMSEFKFNYDYWENEHEDITNEHITLE